MFTIADAMQKIRCPDFEQFLKETGIRKGRWERFAIGTESLFEVELENVASTFGVNRKDFAQNDGRATCMRDWKSAKQAAEIILRRQTVASQQAKRRIDSEITCVAKERLKIDKSYQRDISPQLVKRIAKDWNPLYLGVLHVAEVNGGYWVIDGQHRLEAAKLRPDIKTLPCVIHKSIDQKTAAEMFLGINGAKDAMRPTRKSLTTYQKYNALITAGDLTALKIQSKLHVAGYWVPKSSIKARGLNAIMAVYRAYAKDEDSAETALDICLEMAMGGSVNGRAFEGIYEFIRNTKRHAPPIPENEWRKRIVRIGLEAIENRIGIVYAATRSCSSYICGTTVLDMFNYGQRNKIEWISAKSSGQA